MRSELIGYADRFSYSPGDRIRVMARTDQAKYRATIVRVIHGDENPEGPGFKEQVLETDINGEYPGRKQTTFSGSGGTRLLTGTSENLIASTGGRSLFSKELGKAR